MASELERDREKIQGMTTEEIQRSLDVQRWGPEARKIGEGELNRRRDSELREMAARNLEATARLVEQTTRLVEATERLVGQTGLTARFTRLLAWATWGLFLVTAILVIRQFLN